MKIIHFSGSIQTDDDAVVIALMSGWLGDVSVKERIANEEIQFRDDRTHVYVQNPVIGGTTRDEFVIEGERKGEPDEVRQFLLALSQACEGQGLEFEMSYWEVDAEGRDIGEEIEL